MGLHAIPASYLTKSAYLDYRTCPGFAWLKQYQPELVPAPDATTLRRLRDGIETELLARTRYPEGVLVKAPSTEEAIAETIASLAVPETTVLFQATLATGSRYLAKADVLIRDGEGWRLLEVKSVCTVDKDHHVDVAFQLATFEAAGLVITGVSILHLDRRYRRNGACDVQLLFTETDVTAEARSMVNELWFEMATAAETLACADWSADCECHRKTKNNRCEAFAHFHSQVPAYGSVYEISRLHATKLNAAVDRGVYRLEDWPDDVQLPDKQKRQLDVHRSGRAHVDQSGIAHLLSGLSFPLYFLDYETCNVPVPMFDDCWPYQQVPFQYSLHIVEGDGTIAHREHLATAPGESPFLLLAEELMRQIGPVGSVVSWHASFERGRNRELAEASPAMAWFFHDLNERMVDLEKVVTEGHYVHPGFRGRSSIKVVLPIAAPDLSYETMAIGDGMTASDRWLACMLGEIADSAREQTFTELLAYCELDTWAMVRIWQHLGDLCAEKRVA